MRKRKRDWPQRVYKFHAVVIEPPPQEMWALAIKMRDAWNYLAMQVADCRAVLAAITHDCPRKKPSEKGKRRPRCSICTEHWNQQWGKARKEIRWFGFDSETETGLIDRAQIAARLGKLNDHGRLLKLKIWHRWGGGGVPIRALFSEHAERIRLTPISPQAYADNSRAARRLRREGYGQFRVPGTSALIRFRADLHRQFPPGSIVKRAAWTGRKHPARGWQWAVDVTVEEPPLTTVRPMKNICGLDLGWRVMEGYLRVGFLVDNAGRRIELRLPMTMDTNATRRHNRREGVRYCPASMMDLFKLRSERDGKLEDLKAAILKVLPELEHRPGWQKMRNAGIRRLKNHYSEIVPLIEEWEKEDRRLQSFYLAVSDRMIGRRDWLYGNLAKWLAINYDAICWEKDLGIKEMAEAEEQSYALENSQKYRHFAAIGRLRSIIKNGAGKYGARLIDCKTAGSTITCVECGATMEPTANLEIECSSGHRWDQDCGAAINLMQDGFSQTPELSAQEFSLRRFGFFKRGLTVNIPEELRAVALSVHPG